jgi:hypothetical protein
MVHPMKYDDASWHCGGDFPPDSPEEYGGTHIALFLRWCFNQGWAGDVHLKEEAEDTQRVVDGTMSATEYLFTYCDGKLTEDDLNEEGNAFAARYYGDDGQYLADYAEHFGDLMYVAPVEAHDFSVFSSVLQLRLEAEGSAASESKPSKPWWRFW